jgi:hypothetical protein
MHFLTLSGDIHHLIVFNTFREVNTHLQIEELPFTAMFNEMALLN